MQKHNFFISVDNAGSYLYTTGQNAGDAIRQVVDTRSVSNADDDRQAHWIFEANGDKFLIRSVFSSNLLFPDSNEFLLNKPKVFTSNKSIQPVVPTEFLWEIENVSSTEVKLRNFGLNGYLVPGPGDVTLPRSVYLETGVVICTDCIWSVFPVGK